MDENYEIYGLALDPVKNFGKVTVSAGYGTGDTTIYLTAGHVLRLPNASVDGPFNLVWYDNTQYSDPSDDPNVEIVRCTITDTDYDFITITRAQEGISASNKNTPGHIYKMILTPTKKTIIDIQTDSQSKVDTHAALTSNIHNFDTSGNAPPQSHGSSAHTGIIGDHQTNLTGIGTYSHAQIDAYIDTGPTNIGMSILQNDVKKLFTSFTTGTDIFHAHDAEVQSPNTTVYTKVKTITLGYLPSSSLKISFDLGSPSNNYNAWGRIYRNGVAIGTEHMVQSASYINFVETISGWNIGDRIEIYAHGLFDGANTFFAKVRNFRILGTATKIENS